MDARPSLKLNRPQGATRSDLRQQATRSPATLTTSTPPGKHPGRQRAERVATARARPKRTGPMTDLNIRNAEWLLTLDADERRALTERARAEYRKQLEERVNPDGDLPPEEVAFRIKQLRRVLLAEAGRKSGESRRAKAEERKKAANEAALDELADQHVLQLLAS